MLLGDGFSQLARLTQLSEEAILLAQARQDPAVVVRAIQAAQQGLEALETLVAPWKLDSGQLSRHLGFIGVYFRKGEHEQYASDIADIRERDLPATAASVAEWERALYDPGLVMATQRAWADGNFLTVVRDAFVHLEDRLRAAGQVDPTKGYSGDKLVTLLLAPASPSRIDLGQGMLGATTTGEQEGVLNLFKGAFLLFRNAAAHRSIPYSAAEAQILLNLAELCLRILEGESRA